MYLFHPTKRMMNAIVLDICKYKNFFGEHRLKHEPVPAPSRPTSRGGISVTNSKSQPIVLTAFGFGICNGARSRIARAIPRINT